MQAVSVLNKFCKQQKIPVPPCHHIQWSEKKNTKYPGIYIIGTDDNLVYVGKSTTMIMSRLHKHLHKIVKGATSGVKVPKKWSSWIAESNGNGNTLPVTVFDMSGYSKSAIHLVEAFMIHQLQPIANAESAE